MKYIIDIREENELLHTRFISKSNHLTILCIPMRVIFANKEFIQDKSINHKIYILCRSGRRSDNIKKIFFNDNDNIISLEGGLKSMDKFSNDIETIKGKGGFGLMQYIQTMFAFIILSIIISFYYNIDKKILLSILILFLFFIIYQIITQSCIIISI